MIDRATQKVTVRGKKLDPTNVLRRLRKKYSRNVELISPKPNSEIKEMKEQKNNDDNQVCQLSNSFNFYVFVIICCS